MSTTSPSRSVRLSCTAILMLLAAVLSLGADAPKPAPNPLDNALDQMRKRLGDNRSWYGTLTVNIQGSGHHSDVASNDESSFSIRHDAEIKFKISAMQGELQGLSGMEEAMKRMPNNPLISANLDKMRNLRHWYSAMMNQKPEDEDDIRLLVQDRWDQSGEEPREGGGGPHFSTYRTKEGKDTRKAASHHSLTIDFVKQTYDLVFDPKVDLLDITETSGGGVSPAKSTSRRASATGIDLRFTNQKLPTQGNILSATQPIPKEKLQNLFGGFASSKDGSIHGTITWTLSPTPLEDVELVIKPEGYDQWLPRGGKDEETEGNNIRMTAILRARNGGGATKVKMNRIAVHLSDVSREPGVCLNLPLSKNSGPSTGALSPDLKFSADHNPGVKIDEEGMRVSKEGGEFTQLPVIVSCYDWGAWGSVVAQASLTDGREIWAYLDGDASTPEVRLPKRDPDSKIADKWKSDMGVSGMKDDADNDKQTGNVNDGDGLTLYEEYRGLIAKGKHTRDHPAGPDGIKPLTPQKKDLIVNNTIKAGGGSPPEVNAGLLLFEKASGIHIVEVDENELPESRQVNLNAGRISAGPQFGLRLSNEKGIAGDSVGETQGAVGRRMEPNPAVSPKGFPKVTINLDAIKADYEGLARVARAENRKLPFTLADCIAATVAHELAHGVGVGHHGSPSWGSAYPQVTEAMKDWRVYDRDGKAITNRPFAITGGVGNPGSDSSGDVNCIMCYNNVYNWCYQDQARTFYGVPFIAQGHIFCSSSKGTGINAPKQSANNKTTLGMFGDATHGNCLSRMRVKDQVK